MAAFPQPIPNTMKGRSIIKFNETTNLDDFCGSKLSILQFYKIFLTSY